MREDARVGDDEDRHHHDEDGERAERGAVVEDEAAERPARSGASIGVGAPSRRRRACVGDVGHGARAPDRRSAASLAGWATSSMKSISSSADSTSASVASSATLPRSSTTKRSAMSKTWWMLWPMKRIERPLARTWRTKWKTFAVSVSDSAVVGSSRTIRSALL